ncbi:hypothetical protein CL634_10160 [bacterium]|nr:hypothetical protein [bacterium]
MADFCLVDDSVAGVGGTALTIDAIVEPEKDNVDFISTSELSLKDTFADYKVFILGNIANYDANSLGALLRLMEERVFVKIEFDYGYCPYRGRIPHEILGKEICSCPFGETGVPALAQIYKNIKINSSHVFYMSENQMKMHNDALLGLNKKKKTVLSSCFSPKDMVLMGRLSQKTKNEKYAIIDGKGGWHTEAKGVDPSIEYAKLHNIEYDVIKTDTHHEMLHLLSDYKGLINKPIIDDTCPRVTIEAKLMGLEVIVDEMSQHITEEWWKQTPVKMVDYLSSRPKLFWETIKCLK